MDDKYLDDKGLASAWGIIKSYINNILASSHYKQATITLPASGWKQSSDGTCHLQSVSVSNTTNNSRVDLRPTPEQLAMLMDKGTTMFILNDEGELTVYAMGTIPSEDITMDVLISEVVFI